MFKFCVYVCSLLFLNYPHIILYSFITNFMNAFLKKGNKDLELKAAQYTKLNKLKQIDYTLAENRQFLVKTFRELDKLINKPRKYCNPFLPKQMGYNQQPLSQDEQKQQDPSSNHTFNPNLPQMSKKQIRNSSIQQKQQQQQKSESKQRQRQRQKSNQNSNSNSNSIQSGKGEKKVTKQQVKQSTVNLIDCIIERSHRIQPYIVGDFNNDTNYVPVANQYQRVNFSSMAEVCAVFNRECPEPKVKIDGEIVFKFQNANSSRLEADDFVFVCYKSAAFLLAIEVPPGQILLITKDGQNPLYNLKNQHTSYRTFEQKMNPPVVINCVAVCPRWRLPSRNLTIMVKKNTKSNQEQSKNKRQTGMIRPFDERYDYLQQSRSNVSASNSSSHWF